jgi:hypothetical protein
MRSLAQTFTAGVAGAATVVVLIGATDFRLNQVVAVVPSVADEPTQNAHAGVGSGIVVDGVAVETKADPACYPGPSDADPGNRYINCGNGTVLDTATGLLWLQDANCLFRGLPVPDSGERDWWEANAFVAQLESGECGLTDHSQPGDWRLPTRAEWQTTVEYAGTLGCDTVGPGKPPTLTNDAGTDCLDVGPTSFSRVAPPNVFVMSLQTGSDSDVSKSLGSSVLVWPVRSGQ